jgi:hypothetical protein
MRIKSQWFKGDRPKSAKENASAMAFIIWRVAQNALKRMRAEQYDIDPGAQYFAFMAEFAVFLAQIADRIAHQTLEGELRAGFTTAVVLRLGEIFEENERDLLGEIAGPSYKNQFITLFNDRSTDYAEFGFGDEGPDFAFMRYLGNCVMHIMPKKDQSWVIDQIMAIEAPEAVATIRKGMTGIFQPGPSRPTRRSGASVE